MQKPGMRKCGQDKEVEVAISLLPQELHPLVLVLVADHIRSWSLVRRDEIRLVDFEGQEALISFRISFTTAVGHVTVGVAELFHLADFIQEHGGLQREMGGSELVFIYRQWNVLSVYLQKKINTFLLNKI